VDACQPRVDRTRGLLIRVVRAGVDGSAMPDRLADVEVLCPDQAVGDRRVDFRLSGPGPHGEIWLVNGAPFDLDSWLASRARSTELWTLTSDFHHPVHVHLGHFRGTPQQQGRVISGTGI
jgi:spore coat protein A